MANAIDVFTASEQEAKMNLYELDTNYKNVLQAYDTAENENDKQALLDTLDCLDDAIDVKLENYGKVYRNAMAEYDALKSEKDRLDRRMKSAQNLANRIKEGVKEYLENNKIKSYTAGLFKYTVRKNPAKVIIDDVNKLDSKYKLIAYKPLSGEIKKEILAGKEVDGAHIEIGTSLLIK